MYVDTSINEENGNERGITLAKEQGKYRGRKPISFNEERFRAECQKWRSGEQTAVETMKRLDMKRNRFYRIVKEFGV